MISHTVSGDYSIMFNYCWKCGKSCCVKVVNFVFQIFEMMDAKARQDCIKEIDLLKVW